ncbi:MAG: 23S rRNA (adenine(2503)-C(2))-methyltransferase RlmN [Treponema sp.]|jgi:23S rRNA (adenine2503-C2)-methyltransferase|nr:23S rRNA (adenine(2503)-C(2))-methyltransferase RlmN [Treponema sp.]
MPHIALAGLLPEEISARFQLAKPFMGRQIFKWIARGVSSFDAMTDLPLELRGRLLEQAALRTGNVLQTLEDPDGTIKLQIEFPDRIYIETVLLADEAERKTACVSSQAGCALGCRFCRTGQLGFTRNLTAGEIVEQFLLLEKISGPLDNVVFMGMGEPLLNLEAVRKAVSILTHPAGRNLSLRRITISTAGIIPGIYDLADRGPAVRLAVSLTTADPALRNDLMPVARSNSLEELKKAIAYHGNKTGKRCTLEAALISGVNTGSESARQLAEFAGELGVHVNLIPWNPTASLPFAEPAPAECREFVRMLEERKIPVTLRTRRGRKIGGACGQLGQRKRG